MLLRKKRSIDRVISWVDADVAFFPVFDHFFGKYPVSRDGGDICHCFVSSAGLAQNSFFCARSGNRHCHFIYGSDVGYGGDIGFQPDAV